jgi:hypothetical protein
MAFRGKVQWLQWARFINISCSFDDCPGFLRKPGFLIEICIIIAQKQENGLFFQSLHSAAALSKKRNAILNNCYVE